METLLVRNILCPIDFSDIARDALEWAGAMARWHGATVDIHYVHATLVPVLSLALPALESAPLDEAERAAIVQAIREYAPFERFDRQLADVVDEHRDVARAIVRRALESAADLVVLGTHGRSGFERMLLGSVSEKVLRKAACPVLAVPPRRTDIAAPGTMHRIVCPVDFSAASQSALHHAISLAQRSGARLTVAHIIEMPVDTSGAYGSEFSEARRVRFAAARAAMANVVEEASGAWSATDALLLVGRAAREILRLASEQQADLVVIGVHGCGAVDATSFGCTTQEVVRSVGCPVLTVRASVTLAP